MHVIPYSPGHKPDLWDPDPEEQNHRFALGRVAGASTQNPPFITICMNTSFADQTQSDKTVNRLVRASTDNNHTGWMMLNLYPERATNASNLSPYDSKLSEMNCAVIEHQLRTFGLSEVLGAWGDLKHPTLQQAKVDVLDTLDQLGVALFTFDDLTARGNPRHPMQRRRELQMMGAKRYLVRSGKRLVERGP
nr:DUF1643 domain-containing protein [Arthrobacter zhangbolii]